MLYGKIFPVVENSFSCHIFEWISKLECNTLFSWTLNHLFNDPIKTYGMNKTSSACDNSA